MEAGLMSSFARPGSDAEAFKKVVDFLKFCGPDAARA
jgi:hypothetical protein